ncbi:phospholipid-translocating P-type ATPase [Nadsonia fulvescens var. elongata DSM 6958]|uniref:Phospholipid-transporting ATPase n=1 Tax=Nadsonia fulvescens var. elongata DSM 6958 TaxID=857566 RepID=A0A1E3PEI8_9ASCO|nr:phospholipid-translocating P-type ATPase [Nadsonia fulvescens var. elongata DSM 6958]
MPTPEGDPFVPLKTNESYSSSVYEDGERITRGVTDSTNLEAQNGGITNNVSYSNNYPDSQVDVDIDPNQTNPNDMEPIASNHPRFAEVSEDQAAYNNFTGPDHGHNKTIMKRLRFGTRRNKAGKPTTSTLDGNIGRKSTLSKRLSSITDYKKTTSFSNNSDYPDSDTHKEPRKVFFNTPLPADLIEPESNLPKAVYARNKIRTTKYTPLSFVPKNIVHQFKNVANVYFLLIVILGAFRIFGVASPGLAAVPLIVIVVLTAIKDAFEDYRRMILDLELNNTHTEILNNFENVNIRNEKISLWRRMKKATTRGFVLMSYKFTNRKRSKQSSNAKPDVFANVLAPIQTVNSAQSGHRDSVEAGNFDSEDAHYHGASGIDGFNDHPRLSIASDHRFVQESDLQPNEISVMDHLHPVSGQAKFKKDFWKNVRVGDFVRVRNNNEIPADLVILSTSDVDGACNVETKNLDGETNLKVRQAMKSGEGIKHSNHCERAKFWIESEPPHPNLYTFNGVAKWTNHATENSGETMSEPLTINNLLLRGCTLRNTKWVIGVVVATGDDTKIMLNSGITPTKISLISRELNVSVIVNFVLLFCMCFVAGMIQGFAFKMPDTSIVYFEFGMIGGKPSVSGLISFWVAVIIFQSLVPISLYISIEIIKTIQAFFIFSDEFMYHEPLDYPCTPKSWNISDDLGQIEYIFSDKTGTLTQNVMEFKKCTINGISYGLAYTEAMAGMRKRLGVDTDKESKEKKNQIIRDKELMLMKLRSMDDNLQLIDDEVTFVSSALIDDINGQSGSEQAHANKHFFFALAICHTVLTEESTKYTGRRDFKAQSPDEAALVGTARDLGFTFVTRDKRGAILNIHGREQEVQVLNILEFNSTRKRMSVIIKLPSTAECAERILLICKGADSIIYERLIPNTQRQLRQQTAQQLQEFANEGLRTLCLAQREISASEYQEWNIRNEQASVALTNREQFMEEVADSIERNLTLLGGTAIEDRLQDGVPDSIALLGMAGIKLWVLTGDKLETAINIGFSCNLLNNDMQILVIDTNDGSLEACDLLISGLLQTHFGMTGSDEELEAAKLDHSPPKSNFAVVIDGDALKLALHESLAQKFVLLGKQCKSVLCCRVSPAQKAAVVKVVKNTLGVLTLSIGDGANDVAMIQSADVGVGIAGEEGRQAAMSSDYAIGQFKFLTRLLLIHGRWSYKRLAEMIPNFFYKNIVFTFCLFWYGIYNNFDGSYLFEYTYLMFYNLAFTSLPIIFLGVLDQDVNDKISLHVPQLYRTGILRLEWSQSKVWVYMIDGLYQSVISFFFPFLMYYTGVFNNPQGLATDHRFLIGIVACTISVLSCNTYVLLNQANWDWLSVLIFFLSNLILFFWTGVYSTSSMAVEFYKSATIIYGTLAFWACSLLGVVACLLPHICYMAIQNALFPKDIDIIRELWFNGHFDELPECSLDVPKLNTIFDMEDSCSSLSNSSGENEKNNEKST